MPESVTLVAPDGRRYTTDDPAEITMLVSSRGYVRLRDQDRDSGGYVPPPPVTRTDLDGTLSTLDRDDGEPDQDDNTNQ